jgi:hypothetical protein
MALLPTTACSDTTAVEWKPTQEAGPLESDVPAYSSAQRATLDSLGERAIGSCPCSATVCMSMVVADRCMVFSAYAK